MSSSSADRWITERVAEIQTVVVGAGVVGLAVARALALSGREVIVLERADRTGTETSSRNSEVIHSGIYYAPASLKARLCVAGRDLLYAYCERRGIPHRRLGKLIVATTEAEIATLERYEQIARSNAVGETRWLTADQVRHLEPAVQCVRGLQVPCSGILDVHALMESFWADLQAAGGELVLRTPVTGGRRLPDGRFELHVDGNRELLQCRELVNCAGLYATELAGKLAGCDNISIPRASFARGHYFTLSGRSPFSRLVYPVADSAGLGTHVTLDLAGRARFGPDVQWIDTPDYTFDESRRAAFAEAIRHYYPALEESRLQPGYTGIRPKIAGPGEPPADFRIDGPAVHSIPGLVHLFGIESPGLTAAMALGSAVTDALVAAS